MNWITLVAQISAIATLVMIWIAYRKLYKEYETVYKLWQEADRLLTKNVKENLALVVGSLGNVPCEIREVHNSYQVIRKFDESVYIIKGFINEDKDYAKRCAEELRDLINEEI